MIGACAQPSPQEQMAMTRARYEASMNGFLVDQQPIDIPPPPAEEETADGEVEADATEVEESASGETTEQPVSLRQSVLLDVVIRHESAEKLDGITVDITMADGERELQVWRAWFDTSAIEKGPGTQFSYTLEDVDYQPGYGFSADIRYPVPPEEISLYREFSGLGGPSDP
jgi:hypothetical protein